MNAKFNNLSAFPKPVGHIIHIGAGACSGLQEYIKLDAKKIILVEPENQQAAALSAKVRNFPNIDVLPWAISDLSSSQPLYVLSNKRDSSLLQAEKLLQLYPGLQLLECQEADCKTFNELIEHHCLDKQLHNLLIIETQGLEDRILATANVDLLQMFAGIIIRRSDNTLYQNENRIDMRELLEHVGFEQSHVEPELYGNVFKRIYFERNSDKIALSHSIEQQAVTNEMLKERSNECEYLQSVVTDTENRLKEKELELENMRDLLEQSNLNLKEQSQAAANVKAEFDQLKNNNEANLQTLEIKQQEVNLLAIDFENFKRDAEAVKIELQEAKQTASLSVKLQLLKEAELADLQKKYQNAIAIQESQHELLNKLSERLRLAAGYFHQISEDQYREETKQLSQPKKRRSLAGFFSRIKN